MGRFIIKLEDKYLEWSTVVDAPVTFGMTLDEFKAYYKDEYGASGMHGLDERLKRVEEKGTSSMIDDSLDSVISHNRAGKNETHLSKKKLIEWYVVKCQEPK